MTQSASNAGIFSASDGPDAPDAKEALEYLMRELDESTFASLRFNRRKLCMHDAKLIVARLKGAAKARS